MTGATLNKCQIVAVRTRRMRIEGEGGHSQLGQACVILCVYSHLDSSTLMRPNGKARKASHESVQERKKAAKQREAAHLYYTQYRGNGRLMEIIYPWCRHPEAREKSRDPPKKNKRWAEQSSGRIMREQPPFRANNEVPNEEAQASGTPTLEEEAVAHAALRTLARKRQTSYRRVHAREFLKLICLLSSAANGVGEGEPMTLSEIDAQSSSEGSVPAVCEEEVITRQRLQRQIRNLAADGDNYSERASDTSVCELARQRVLELKEQRRIRLVEKQERVLNEQRQCEMRWLVNSGGRGSDRPSAEEFKIWGSKDSDVAVSYCTLPTTLCLGSGVGGIVCGAAERQSVECVLQARENRQIK
ncbi:hypothetical protein B0H11DRAFT_1912503 [Mycena galericulata]|nr:hypothetical protein B0H11DRAFT_1912503 [Mycena galericulata]